MRNALRRHAAFYRRDISSLLTDLIAEELRTHQTGRRAKLTPAHLEYGPKAEIRDEQGILYHCNIAPFRGKAHLVLRNQNDPNGYVNFPELRQSAWPLKELIDLIESEYDWNTPAYRAMCEKLALDPDWGRPQFREKHMEVVNIIDEHVRLHNNCDKVHDISFRIKELLRSDRKPEFYDYYYCKNIIENWEFEFSNHPFQSALDQVAVDEITSSRPVVVRVTFLPSWGGNGFTASIYLWSNECEPDGWSSSLYSHLSGVALLPNLEDLATRTVVNRLQSIGVTFLSMEQAQEYMDNEGSYWALEQEHWMCPPGLEPSSISVIDKLKWNIKKPPLPLYEAYLNRKGG